MNKTLGAYALEQLEKDKNLVDHITVKELTFEDLCKYIDNQAWEELEGENGAIEDKVVYGWVIHFLQDGEKEQEEEHEQAPVKKEKPKKAEPKIKAEVKRKVVEKKEEKKEEPTYTIGFDGFLEEV